MAFTPSDYYVYEKLSGFREETLNRKQQQHDMLTATQATAKPQMARRRRWFMRHSGPIAAPRIAGQAR